MPEDVAVALLYVNASVSPLKLFYCCIVFCLFLKLNCNVSWNVNLALLNSTKVSHLEHSKLLLCNFFIEHWRVE